MRIDEYTNLYLYCLYEGGGYDFRTISEMLELNRNYERQKSRETITYFINKFCKTEENKHPLLNLHPQQTRELIEMLQRESRGEKLNLFNEGPSVF